MQFFLAALAFGAVGASAQSTVLAPCGTSCPSAAPDKMITRTAPSMSEGTPCPSLLVSSISGAGNGTKPMMTGAPSPTSFPGGANHVAGSMGAVAVAAIVAMLL